MAQRKNRLGLRGAVAAMSVAALTAGCFGGTSGEAGKEFQKQSKDSGTPQPGGTYRMIFRSDAPSLDPLAQSISTTSIVVGFVYSKLVDFKSGPDIPYGTPEYEGDLAKSWDVSEDGKTYTFHLRKGVTFQDKPPVNGREFTSADVACTINAIQERGHQKADVSAVDKVETPDPYTVVFKLSELNPDFVPQLAGHFLYMLPCEGTKGEFDLAKQAIGTGPFQLDKWVPDKEIIYNKNPKYYEAGKPYLDAVHVAIVPDTAAATAALRTKTTDYVSTITDKAAVTQLLKSNPDINVFNELSSVPLMVYMNQEVKPFDDIRVRKAVAYAIDRKSMMKAIRPGGQIMGPTPSKLSGALTPEEAVDLQPYDPAKAKALLKEAGYPNGFSTKVLTTNGYSDHVVREAQWVQEDLAKVGIKAEIDMQDYATYFTMSYPTKAYEMGVGLQTPWLTVDDYLTSMWHSKGTRNWYNINDPKLDTMIDKQRSILDPAKRKADLEDIQRYIMTDVANPYMMYVYESLVLTASYVHDSWPAPEYGSRHMRNVWLGPEAPGRKN